MYQRRDLDTSSWDSWEADLVDQLLGHQPHENLVVIPRAGTFPVAPAPSRRPLSHRLRLRQRQLFDAPVIQAMRDGNSLLLDLTGPASLGGEYAWTDDQVEGLYDLGWPHPVNEGVVVFTMYLPHSPLPPRPYLPHHFAEHAASLICSTLRDVMWSRTPADVDVEGGVVD
ncbi:hypothetical protein PZ938_14825 [Luteipulveratus sp. YIM 133132]|uniref:TY-Chap N-terminal domain-containing protein n=1 Tax=Luteipulveratus flavus TaxID=3031728 RepID=A0ABT6CBH3_9MICO|nr:MULTISPECIES: hypothetical protein [unclassified Luteipulveratus]MDE9366887.1 hypothetical protein [Luteipulveratus sp. YIM 133132]MDF8266106.1 hypothetical protein [Luteipulveratus sp. YIM 133296]